MGAADMKRWRITYPSGLTVEVDLPAGMTPGLAPGQPPPKIECLGDVENHPRP